MIEDVTRIATDSLPEFQLEWLNANWHTLLQIGFLLVLQMYWETSGDLSIHRPQVLPLMVS